MQPHAPKLAYAVRLALTHGLLESLSPLWNMSVYGADEELCYPDLDIGNVVLYF